MAPYHLFAGGYEGRILTLSFDPATKTIKTSSSVECGNAPTWLTLSQDGKHLYAADEWGEEEGMIMALAVGEDGVLKPMSSVKTGGLWPCHSGLLTSTTPHRLLTTNYKGASLHSIPLLPSGDLETQPAASQLLSYLGQGTVGTVTERQQQAHPHGAHVDPRGLVCVVPDLGTDDLRIVGVKEDSTLENVETIHLEAGDGPRHVLYSHTGERLYVLNELHNSITVFAVSYPSPPSPPPPSSSTSFSAPPTSRYPSFTLLQSRVSILPSTPNPHQASFKDWHCAEVVLTPDQTTLIASNRAEAHHPLEGTRQGEPDLLAIFGVKADGTLEVEGRKMVSCGGRAPRHMSLNSESLRMKGKGVREVEEGRWLAVALHDSDEVVIFERAGVDGRKLREVARARDVGRPGVVLWA
ncbi:hypothetical protein JCM11641_007358 [Rhodosporidiobolus odoratus]